MRLKRVLFQPSRSRLGKDFDAIKNALRKGTLLKVFKSMLLLLGNKPPEPIINHSHATLVYILKRMFEISHQ